MVPPAAAATGRYLEQHKPYLSVAGSGLHPVTESAAAKPPRGKKPQPRGNNEKGRNAASASIHEAQTLPY